MEENIKILQIERIDAEGKEAEVLFEKHGRSFWGFCHPCPWESPGTVQAKLFILEEEISDEAFWGENRLKQKKIESSKEDKLRYYCYGAIQSINPVIINCGELTLSLGDWINDPACIGRFVYFVVARLDIQEV